MEIWSQWLNELLCMMERLAGCTRGLEVLDVGLTYHEGSLLFDRESEKLLMYLIDMFLYRHVLLNM